MVKENLNPKVHQVHRRRRNVVPLGFQGGMISSLSDEALCVFAPTYEKSMLVALTAAENLDGKGTVQKLKNAGLMQNIEFDSREKDEMSTKYGPRYIPFNIKVLVKKKAPSEILGRDDIDAEEIFDMIRDINDPEHPLTLEQLNVVCQDHIEVQDVNSEEMKEFRLSSVDIRFTPTIPHCSMATLIGLSIRVKLLRSLPTRFKVTVRINPGTHTSEKAINRQLNDKERVAAALENKHLLGVVNKCIAPK